MKSLRWRSLSGGILAVLALAAMAFVVLKYARTGVVRGDKFRLYIAVPDANGVLGGTDVWLNGQRIGTVTRIDFAPATAPAETRVIIVTDLLETMRENIRLNSRVDLRSGGTIIGAPVIYLSAGTLAARAVVENDTLRGAGKSDLEIAASRVTESLEEVPAILDDARVIAANARQAGNRLRTMMTRDRGRGSFREAGAALSARLSSDHGSAGRLLRDSTLRARVSSALSATDSVRVLLSSRMNAVGRFRRDSTLSRAIEQLRADVGIVRSLAASPTGTIGRARLDSALRRDLDSAFAELSALFADLRKHPLRYAKVF